MHLQSSQSLKIGQIAIQPTVLGVNSNNLSNKSPCCLPCLSHGEADRPKTLALYYEVAYSTENREAVESQAMFYI